MKVKGLLAIAIYGLIISIVINPAYGALLQTYSDPLPGLGHNFGGSGQIDGTNVLLGAARGGSAGIMGAGIAYLFNTAGTLLQTYNNPTPQVLFGVGDNYGGAVSIDGTLLVIGAKDDRPTGDNLDRIGSAYLYDTSGTLLLTRSNPANDLGGRFGSSVSIDGSNFVVGAPGNTVPGVINNLPLNVGAAGQAYLYNTAGTLLQTYTNPTPDFLDNFGASVAISGDLVLIGSPSPFPPKNPGKAYLYNTAGTLLQTYNSPAGIIGDAFGGSVDLQGTNVLIGARGVDTGALNAGSAYLFNTAGTLLQTYNNPTPEQDDSFGVVGIDGTNVFVGAPGDNTGGDNAGSAYLFNTSGPALLQTFNNPTPEVFDQYGSTVSCSGNFNVIGAPGDNTGADGSGSAYLYDKIPGDPMPPDNGTPIGGELIPLDTTMVLIAGTQTTAAWMIPVLVSAIGIGLVIARKF